MPVKKKEGGWGREQERREGATRGEKERSKWAVSASRMGSMLLLLKANRLWSHSFTGLRGAIWACWGKERERERKTERSLTWLQCEQRTHTYTHTYTHTHTHTHTPGSLCLVTPDINRQLINERKSWVYAGGERKTGEREKGKKVKIKIVQLPITSPTRSFFIYFSLSLSLFLEQVILQHKSMLAGQAASY